MTLKSELLCALVFSNVIIASEYTGVNAFRWHSQEISVELKDLASPEKSHGVLDSLTSVARSGAFVWSHHISETVSAKRKRPNALKQTSSIVSKLHDQIQKSRKIQELNIDRVDDGNEDDSSDSSLEEQSYHGNKSHWPDHFYEEIFAYIAGGAAATSAFSAVVVGTIFATFVVTIGAVTTALFFDDDLVGTEKNNLRDDLDTNDIHTGPKTDLESKDCDLDESFFEVTTPNQSSLERETFDDATFRELKKCFAGKPSTSLMIFTELDSPNTCSRSLPQYEYSGFGIDHGLHEDYEVPSEICDQLNSNEQPLSEEENADQPKVIELIWHDSYSTAANSYYSTKMNNKQRRRNARNRKVHVTGQSFDFEDTEREGAMLLSDTFKVTSTAFGLLADAVRFAGESTAATAGGTARIVGGAVKAGGWAVGSLGTAISSDKSDAEEDESLAMSSGRKKHRTRKVAGASVKLLGDAIDNVAESLLLAGSATERVAFAAAGAAEGAVRVIEDLTSSISNAFARDAKNEMVPIEQTQIVVDRSPPSKTDEREMIALESPTISLPALSDEEAIEDSTLFKDFDEDDFVNDLSDYLFQASAWIFHNTEQIMQDTAGVSSNAPQLLFVIFALYLASIVLLTEKSNWSRTTAAEKANITEHNKPKLIPEGIITDEADTHSTLTIDSTMKRGLDIHSISVITGKAVHFAVWTAMLPLKLLCIISIQAYRIAFGKKAILLVVHLLGWFFISQMSQNRAVFVAKKARLAGYKSALESVGTSLSGRNHLESAFWLNSIVSRLWRVNELGSSNIGGLEPLLASSAASIFASRLEESYARPSGVAHVSLASLTFGRSVRQYMNSFLTYQQLLSLILYVYEHKPPIIRDVEIKGINAQESKVFLGLDLVMLLEDAVLMLGKSLF